MSEITLEGVTKVFADGQEAVKDMNLEIGDGEFMILVGPSGCGKSTALRMIAGLEDISSGEVKIGGDVVNDRAPKERDIAMVFQNYALYPHMTVRENMGFALKMAGVEKAEIDRRSRSGRRRSTSTQLLDRRPGQALRRPAPAGGDGAGDRARARRPSCWTSRSPTSTRSCACRCAPRWRSCARLETTTVYVTHDQTEAMTLGDRVAVMRAGALQQVGTPAELYGSRPTSSSPASSARRR